MSVPEPSKILTPWATSGLKNTIPAASNPVTGNAGYDQGFPAINMTPKEAGGIPPFGQDFNGILFSITEVLRYLQAGGIPTYSASLSTAIAGYPKGALILGSNGVNVWQNQLDGNTTNPNSGGTNWIDLSLKALPKRAFSRNDYIRIPDVPGGLIIQWGRGTMTAGSASVALNYPITFPNAAIGGFAGLSNGSTPSYMIDGDTVTSTSQIFIRTNANVSAPWAVAYFAIGY